jgi:hypothetical protein
MRTIPRGISSDEAFAVVQQHDNSKGWNCFGMKRPAIEGSIRELLVEAEVEISHIGSMGERLVHEKLLKDLDKKYKGMNLVEYARSFQRVPPCKYWVGWGLGANYMSDAFFHSMLEHMTGPDHEKLYPLPEEHLNIAQRYKWILYNLIRDGKYIVDDIVKDIVNDYKRKRLRELQFPPDSDSMELDHEVHKRPKAEYRLMFGRCPPGTMRPADMMLPTYRQGNVF